MSLSLVTLNVGWSNCARTLSDNAVTGFLEEWRPHVCGLTEVSNIGRTKKWMERLNHALDGESAYALMYAKIGYDYTAILYDTARLTPGDNATASRAGKYLALPVTLAASGHTADIVVTHLPYKRGQAAAVTSLRTYLADETTGPATRLPLGDFNMMPTRLRMTLADVLPARALTNDGVRTTTTGGATDNFCASVGHFDDTEVLADVGSDHYPIVTAWHAH